MEKIIMEQLPDGKVAVNKESLENIVYLAGAVAMELTVPDNVDKEKNQFALFLKEAYGIYGALMLLAFFNPTTFANAIETLDVAEIKYGTASGSDEDIMNKIKKMGKEMYS